MRSTKVASLIRPPSPHSQDVRVESNRHQESDSCVPTPREQEEGERELGDRTESSDRDRELGGAEIGRGLERSSNIGFNFKCHG